MNFGVGVDKHFPPYIIGTALLTVQHFVFKNCIIRNLRHNKKTWMGHVARRRVMISKYKISVWKHDGGKRPPERPSHRCINL
jgi:hypothetical protein